MSTFCLDILMEMQPAFEEDQRLVNRTKDSFTFWKRSHIISKNGGFLCSLSWLDPLGYDLGRCCH